MADLQTFKDRLLYFESTTGLKRAAFERKAGLSNGYIKNFKGSMGTEKIEELHRAFPELSRTWLLTGEGEMLRSNSLSEAGNAELVGHVFRASTPDEGVVNVRFFQISPSATFQEFCEGQNDEADLLPIIPPAGELVDESSCVFEVTGSPCSPPFPTTPKSCVAN